MKSMVKIFVEEKELEEIMFGLTKKQIDLIPEEEVKGNPKYKFKKHSCAMNKFQMNNKNNDKCRYGKAKELKISEVKMHYVVHCKDAKFWDHIIPLEKQIVESYECNM